MSLQTIDVAIGTVFVYLLLTLVASTVVEIISSLCNWRGEMLYKAARNLLCGEMISIAEVYATPFIRSLGRRMDALVRIDVFDKVGWPGPNKSYAPPSYIPPAAFSSAVLYLLWEKCRKDHGDLPIDKPEITAQAIGEILTRDSNGDDTLKAVVATALATQGPSIQAVRLAIERAFNDCMD